MPKHHSINRIRFTKLEELITNHLSFPSVFHLAFARDSLLLTYFYLLGPGELEIVYQIVYVFRIHLKTLVLAVVISGVI